MPLWGSTDAEEDKPKYLDSADKANLVMTDNAVSETTKQPTGWVLTQTYSAVGGNRTRHEVLVALGDATVTP